jgi:hypothetical protein
MSANTGPVHGRTTTAKLHEELDRYDDLPPAMRAVVRNCVEHWSIKEIAQAIHKVGQARAISGLIVEDALQAGWWRMESAKGTAIRRRPQLDAMPDDARRAFDRHKAELMAAAMAAVRRAA